MSVIFGIINKSGLPVSENDLLLIQNSINRRDLTNKNNTIHNNVGLGYAKLEISENKNLLALPIKKETFLITADCKLYNFEELHRLLSLDFAHTDAELLLLLYKKYGIQCVDYLKGEFVFAIWNEVSNELFVATDHMGNRSVYYYDSPDVFIFCSEMKGIEAVKKTINYFNDKSIIEYYFRRSDVSETYNNEIKFLTGAHYLLANEKGVNIHQYWTLKSSNQYHFKTDQEWIEQFKRLFFERIERQINLDVPIGVSLSGGLDSSSITCVLAEYLQKHNKSLYTFSSVLPKDHTGIEKDERKYIECLVRKYPNIIPTFIESKGLNPFEGIQEAFEEVESFPNSFFYMDKIILKEASKKGVKILFNGFGGDYWVSSNGAEVAYELLKNKKFSRSWKLIKEYKNIKNVSYLKSVYKNYITRNSLYKWGKEKFNKSIDWQIQTPLNQHLLQKYSSDVNAKIKFSSRSEFMIERIKSGRIGKSLFQLNTSSQQYGIQSVFPMFDIEIMKFLVDLPIPIFIYDGHARGLIKSSLKGILPTEIVNRNDKLPYVPGYQLNILKEKKLFDQVLSKPHFSLFFEKYFDKNVIEKHFSDITLEEGFTRSRDIVGIRMSQVLIVCYTLEFINSRKYCFKEF